MPNPSSDDTNENKPTLTRGERPKKAKLDEKGHPITERLPPKEDDGSPVKTAIRLGCALAMFLGACPGDKAAEESGSTQAPAESKADTAAPAAPDGKAEKKASEKKAAK